jgi:uncharacterized protein (DUF2267 family)
MTATRSVDAAARATEDWIDDLVQNLAGVDAEQVARAMFALLAARLPAAEVEDAKASTRHELHNLWPS